MKTAYALQTSFVFSFFNCIEVCQKDRKKIVEKLCNIKQLKVFFNERNSAFNIDSIKRFRSNQFDGTSNLLLLLVVRIYPRR